MNKITLATLHKATAQQVFDQVATHLLAQNKKSEIYRSYETYSGELRTDPMCAYRGPDGLMCAVGSLMSDKEYDKDFEGRSWLDLLSSNDNLPGDHDELIADLQATHDNHNVDNWTTRLIGIAKFYGLDYSCTKV